MSHPAAAAPDRRRTAALPERCLSSYGRPVQRNEQLGVQERLPARPFADPERTLADAKIVARMLHRPHAPSRGEMGVTSHGGRIFTVGGALPAFGASVRTNDSFRP